MRGSLSLVLATTAVVACFSVPAAAQGLTPPPPMDPGPLPITTDTSRKLDESESKDSGRNFELVWLDASAGASYVNMSSFNASSLSIDKTSGAAPAFSVGAGLRFLLLVIGARVRYAPVTSFDLWQANLEAGLKIPISKVDVLFGVHGGYSSLGRLSDAGVTLPSSVPTTADDVSVHGFNAGIDFAVDYYLTPLFSIGAGFLGDFLYLVRPKVDVPSSYSALPPATQAAISSSPLYARSGTSAGLQLGGGLRLGVHFGL
jgi:hypothetical protein